MGDTDVTGNLEKLGARDSDWDSNSDRRTVLDELPCFSGTTDTHGASPVAVHGEVRAEEQVGDGQQQRLGQGASSVVLVQLIGLERVSSA